MRCTQCGFTTFDYLDSCPKCRADLYENRGRLNLPAGPLRPISLTEIVAHVQSQPAESAPATADTLEAGEKTTKFKKPAFTGPKTFDLDLSEDTNIETLADKLLAKAGGAQGKKPGETTLSLSLE